MGIADVHVHVFFSSSAVGFCREMKDPGVVGLIDALA